jgi:hypothetical protein
MVEKKSAIRSKKKDDESGNGISTIDDFVDSLLKSTAALVSTTNWTPEYIWYELPAAWNELLMEYWPKYEKKTDAIE